MFLLPQDTTSMILLLIALGLIVFSVRAMLRAMYKKAKRALSKRYFAGLISGKALLIGTLLLGAEMTCRPCCVTPRLPSSNSCSLPILTWT
ncbi:hypothetical protein [Brevibacillus sedimenti]|uniref:hypothetical protein n=1 Tax=Brevibacillus sedimenti TaxID=2613334 RepID=UPI001E537522|nr:hypothetical protein [Anoxybacillus sediminis]UFJ62528.1 hypothetical protein IRT44_07070 [Anoxybacillus sediminis]